MDWPLSLSFPTGRKYGKPAEATAERLLVAELKRRGWGEVELERKRKGDPEKLAIAEEMRRQTTMTLGWLAKRLHMGTRTHLAHLLYWSGRKQREST